MSLRQQIQHEALLARCEMVRNRELIAEGEFRQLVELSASRLQAMLKTGSLFTIAVDGVSYFPSLLATCGVDRVRLYSICRILVPAPPSCRLAYLESRQENLGGISPMEALQHDAGYQLLRRMAHAYAVEWWRTAVKVYEGSYSVEPTGVEAMLTAVTEADPRSSVWRRAEAAILCRGYGASSKPSPCPNQISVFVVLQPSGQFDDTVEARIDARVYDNTADALIFHNQVLAYRLRLARVGRNVDTVGVALKLIRFARKHEVSLNEKQGGREGL